MYLFFAYGDSISRFLHSLLLPLLSVDLNGLYERLWILSYQRSQQRLAISVSLDLDSNVFKRLSLSIYFDICFTNSSL